MEYGLIIVIALAVVVGPFALYIAFGCKHSSGLTLSEMRDCERKIENGEIYQRLIKIKKCEEIAKELNLKIEETDDLEKSGFDSCLCQANNDSGYYGIIKCKKSKENTNETDALYLKNFRCYHEFIHYLWDVGLKQSVTKCYGKNAKGETKSHREQIINYMAAAIAIPKKSLMTELVKYEDKDPKERLKILAEIFQQPQETVARRINEIELLS